MHHFIVKVLTISGLFPEKHLAVVNKWPFVVFALFSCIQIIFDKARDAVVV